MNLENFHTFLNEPANLHRVNISELKSLVAEFPFSANLRILLLLKCKLDKNPELGHHLKMAAAYSPNRSVLYQVMHNPKLMQAIKEEAITGEEFLELKDLSEVQTLLEREESEPAENDKTLKKTIPFSQVEKMSKENDWSSSIFEEEEGEVIPNVTSSVISIDSLLSSIEEEDGGLKGVFQEEDKEEEIEISNKLISEFVIENLSGYSKMLDSISFPDEELPLEIDIPASQPVQKPVFEELKLPQKDSFAGWLAQIEKDLNRESDVPDINKNFEALEATRPEPKPEEDFSVEEIDEEIVSTSENIELTSEPSPPSEEENKPKKSKAKKLAKKSLSLNDEIVSETLAKLLVVQERYPQAAEMYRKLALKFPDKEDFYNDEISKIEGL